MIQNENFKLLKDVIQEIGGSAIAVYNHIEDKWYYYVGDYRPKNPSNHIHFNNIRGKCINYIFDNHSTYFSNGINKQLIITKIEDLPEEDWDFTFEALQMK